MTSRSATSPLVPVWDIWVRLFHWGLVATVALAALTGFLGDARWLGVHLASGGAAAALVLARIVWGVFGPAHARFADFVPRPRALLIHLRGGDRRHRGHNPLGALMVLAVIGGICALAVTGVATLGGWFRLGPLAADLGTQAGQTARDWHEAVAIGLLILVALHLGGVLYESRRSAENLTRAMISGRREARPGDADPIAARPQVREAVAVFLALAAGLALATVTFWARPVPNSPTPRIDPLVAEECGACHMVHHPSVLPAASWRHLMATLDDHFGENAWIDAGDAAEIEAWLTEHAAETVDTAPARLFGQPDPATPAALPRHPNWQRLHAGLPEALFARAPIYTAANCASCHGDAETGRFSPFSITIPKETTR